MVIDYGDLLLKCLMQAEARALRKIEMLRRLLSEHEINPGDELLDLYVIWQKCPSFSRESILSTGVDISPLVEHGRKLAQDKMMEDHVELVVSDVRDVLKLQKHKRGSYGAMIEMPDL